MFYGPMKKKLLFVWIKKLIELYQGPNPKRIIAAKSMEALFKLQEGSILDAKNV